MSTGVAIPLHLGVHLLGLTVAVGLAIHAFSRRRAGGVGWLGVALGAALVAVSHLLEGGLLVGNPGWPLYVRAAGYASLAAGAAGGVAPGAAPVVVAGLPPGAELAAAVAGAAAAFAAFRGRVGRTSDAVALAGGIALWAGADLALRVGALPAALLSLAGSLTVGVWLVRRARRSIVSRMIASLVLALVLLVVGFASLGGLVLGRDLLEDELDSLAAAAEARAVQVADEWTSQTLSIVELFANDTLARVLAVPEGQRIDRLARSIAELPEVDVVLLIGTDGRVLSSFDWSVEATGPLPASEALTIAGDEVVALAVGGASASGLVTLGTADVLAVAATPIFPDVAGSPARDRQAGVLVAARRATDPAFLREAAATAGAEATLVIGGGAAASTLSDEAAEEVATVVADGGGDRLVDVLGRSTFLAVGPLQSSGTTFGYIALTEDAEVIAGAERDFIRTLFLLALAGFAVAAATAGWAARRTTRPVRRLTAVAEQVAAGDRGVRTGIEQPDEVGRLAHAFDDMTTSLEAREAELKTAAAVEAELRNRLEVLTASMGEGLIAVDDEGQVRTVNPAAERLLGVDADEAVGRRLDQVLVGQDTTGGPLAEALGGATANDIRSVRGAIGTGARPTYVAATAAPLRADGDRHLGRVYVLRDVSGEVQVERMKTEFLANISHELRTPLVPIRGYAEVLRKKDVEPERVTQFAESIADATARLERVIGMLVDFSALEAGRLEVKAEPTDVGDVVASVLEGWRERAPDRRFVRRVESDLPPCHLDPDLLRRALDELIDNAVKFSDGPVRLLASDGEDGQVRVTVRDEGEGMAPDEVGLVTADFHQLDGSATRHYGGLGLGLALVHRIAQRFGAELEVESEQGRGTAVHLLLPTSEADRPRQLTSVEGG